MVYSTTTFSLLLFLKYFIVYYLSFQVKFNIIF